MQEDVQTVVVGTGAKDGGLEPGTQVEAITPEGSPNIAVRVIGPMKALGIRFGHMFFAVASGIVATGFTTGDAVIPWHDFSDLLAKAIYAGVITAGVDALKNMGTLFGKLEQKFPFLTGNV